VVSHTPTIRAGNGPSAAEFLGSFLFMRTSLSRNYQILFVNSYAGIWPVFIWSTTPNSGAGSQRSPFLWVPFYLCVRLYTLCGTITKFHTVTQMGKGLVLGGYQRTRHKWAGPISSLVFSVPFYICINTLWRRNTKFDVVTHMGKGLVY